MTTSKVPTDFPPTSHETEKAARERHVFSEFARAASLGVDPTTIESRSPPEPDIRCVVAGETVAFELVEVCTQALAKNVGDQKRRGADPEIIFGGESSYNVFARKVSNRYETDAPIELVCYLGLTATPDHLSLDGIERAANDLGLGPFRRVWLWGHDSVQVVAGAPRTE